MWLMNNFWEKILISLFWESHLIVGSSAKVFMFLLLKCERFQFPECSWILLLIMLFTRAIKTAIHLWIWFTETENYHVVLRLRVSGGLYSSAHHQWIHLCWLATIYTSEAMTISLWLSLSFCSCYHYCCWTDTCEFDSLCSTLVQYIEPLVKE